MKILKYLAILAASAAPSFAAMQVITFSPEHIAVGNAGGSKLFIGANSVLGGLPAGACDEWGRTYFYIELSDDRAKHFEAMALSAQAAGKNLMVYYSDDSPQVMMQWVGLTACKIENVRIQN